jgi:metal-responsive CopG/Arc/MetJ family transcriptional regulator
LGQDAQDALQEIARRRGISRSEAARQAIRETAARDRLRNGLAAEARRLMADPAYVREARDVAAMMEELRGCARSPGVIVEAAQSASCW